MEIQYKRKLRDIKASLRNSFGPIDLPTLRMSSDQSSTINKVR